MEATVSHMGSSLQEVLHAAPEDSYTNQGFWGMFAVAAVLLTIGYFLMLRHVDRDATGAPAKPPMLNTVGYAFGAGMFALYAGIVVGMAQNFSVQNEYAEQKNLAVQHHIEEQLTVDTVEVLPIGENVYNVSWEAHDALPVQIEFAYDAQHDLMMPDVEPEKAAMLPLRDDSELAVVLEEM